MSGNWPSVEIVSFTLYSRLLQISTFDFELNKENLNVLIVIRYRHLIGWQGMLSHRALIEKIYINQEVKKTSSFICDVIGEKYLQKKQTTVSGRENVFSITLYNRPCRYFMYHFLAFSYEILHHETRLQRRKIEGRLLSQEEMERLTKEKRSFKTTLFTTTLLSGIPYLQQNFFLPQSSIMFFPS